MFLASQLPTVKDPAALLALPPLSQVHLQSRMSPEELRKRAERAEWVAKVRPHKLAPNCLNHGLVAASNFVA